MSTRLSPSSNSIRLRGLDALRGMAAMAIVFYHATDQNQAALPKRLEEVRKVYRLLGAPDALEEDVFDWPHSFHEPARERGYQLLERALS